MAETNPQSILVALAESDPAGRALLSEALRSVGLSDLRVYADVATLRHALADASIELLIVGADLAGAFDLVRDLRHGRVGANPFATVMALVTAERGAELTAAVAAGIDEVVTRPLKEAQLMARLRRGGGHRTPFVAASDFIGPDRRAKERPGALPRLAVPNILGDRLSGRSAPGAADRHVLVMELRRRRLAAHGLRLAMLCRLMAEGEGGSALTEIASILTDAAGLAEDLGEPEVALLCRMMSARSRALPALGAADRLAFVTALAEGMVPVLRPGLSAAEHITAAERAASTYGSRPRNPSGDILTFGRYTPEPAMDIPEISLRAVPKGGILFREGAPAVAAHVVTSGAFALYREDDDTRRVLAKAVRGEMLGDMAAADDQPHHTTAVALEDSTVAALPSALLGMRTSVADPVVAGLLRSLQHSLRMAHEIYSPRSRHIADSVAEMRAQVAAILGYVQSVSAPARLKAEAGAVAARLGQMTDELVALIEQHPELDRRARAIPDQLELGAREDGG